MATDTISTDPRLLEEARRAAAEKPAPKIPYDPKAILREAYDRILDPKYNETSFEKFWDDAQSVLQRGEIVDTLTEQECRDFTEALVLRAQSNVLMKAAAKVLERSTTLHKAGIYKLCERRGRDPNKDVGEGLDISTGAVRKMVVADNPLTAIRELISKFAPPK